MLIVLTRTRARLEIDEDTGALLISIGRAVRVDEPDKVETAALRSGKRENGRERKTVKRWA